VHHVARYAICKCTDVSDLTFGCGTQHGIVQPGKWSARKNAKGETEWIPPPHSPASGRYPHDRGQTRINTFHHPENLLLDDDEKDEPA
jgi:hypothetical protein